MYVSSLCTVSQYMTNFETNMPSLFSNCLYYAWRFLNRDSFKLFSLLNHRPSQHGADLLSLLSKLLDENTKPGETENHLSVVTVSLALQALEELCKAEVCLVNVEEHKIIKIRQPCGVSTGIFYKKIVLRQQLYNRSVTGN